MTIEQNFMRAMKTAEDLHEVGKSVIDSRTVGLLVYTLSGDEADTSIECDNAVLVGSQQPEEMGKTLQT